MKIEFKPHKLEWTPEKVARFWDFLAQDSSHDEDRFSLHSGQAILRWANETIDFNGKRVLDFGCGLGHLVEFLCQMDARPSVVEGVDFSAKSVEETVERCKRYSNFGGCLLAQDLPSSLEDDSFDVVFLIEVIEHLEDEELAASFNEIRRVLKPGGILVITTPNDENLERKQRMCPDCGAIFHPKQHVKSWSVETLTAAMDREGFVREDCQATNWQILSRPKVVSSTQLGLYRALGRRRSVEVHLGYIGHYAR